MAKLHVEDRGTYFYFRWEGLLTVGEMVAATTEYYPRLEQRHKLVEMSNADLSTLNLENLVSVARNVLDVQPQGGAPKTAFVASKISTYSILTRYILLAFQNGVRIEYRVFGDIDEATAWLTER